MNNSDAFGLIQTICAVIGALGIIIGSILGILGYLKLMKSIDDNAKERQAAIETSAKLAEAGLNDVAHKFDIMSMKNKYAIIALLASGGLMMGSWMYQVTQLRKEWQEIKKKG